MKKIMLMGLLFLTLGMITSQAQTISSYNATITAAEDTLTNTDTAYVLFPAMSKVYDLGFKLTMTKVSGTVGGAAILQGSYDKSQWISLNSEDGQAAAGQYQDTATISNGTASYWWALTHSTAVYPYYQIRVITSGTQVSIPTGKVYTYFKKPD